MNGRILVLYCVVISLVLLLGCKNNTSNQHQSEQTKVENEDQEEQFQIPDAAYYDILNSIPSPLETSSLVKKLGIGYNGNLPNKTSKKDAYTTTYKKSINLGVYGTDLGYASFNQEFGGVAEYLDVIRLLGEDLKVGQFFDYQFIKEQVKYKDDLNSLIHNSQVSFEKMNKYLQSRRRSNISVLMLVGGWVEALYISTSIYQIEPNQELKDHIGSQKISLEKVIVLLDIFKRNPHFNKLLEQFSELQKSFDVVTIERIDKEPTFEEIDGISIAIDNTETIIHLTLEQVADIHKNVSKIRAEIIS